MKPDCSQNRKSTLNGVLLYADTSERIELSGLTDRQRNCGFYVYTLKLIKMETADMN
jgi:hypothetical protein